MKHYVVLMGALLTAAPVFSQEHEILRFALGSSRAEVQQILGPPALVADFGEFVSWQYQIGFEDHHEYSHQFVFRAATGELISVTRNYEQEVNVDSLFPPAQTSVHRFEDSAFGARARRLPGGGVLLAMGSMQPGRPTAQLLLIRESELPVFHAWLKLPPR